MFDNAVNKWNFEATPKFSRKVISETHIFYLFHRHLLEKNCFCLVSCIILYTLTIRNTSYFILLISYFYPLFL